MMMRCCVIKALARSPAQISSHLPSTCPGDQGSRNPLGTNGRRRGISHDEGEKLLLYTFIGSWVVARVCISCCRMVSFDASAGSPRLFGVWGRMCGLPCRNVEYGLTDKGLSERVELLGREKESDATYGFFSRRGKGSWDRLRGTEGKVQGVVLSM